MNVQTMRCDHLPHAGGIRIEKVAQLLPLAHPWPIEVSLGSCLEKGGGSSHSVRKIIPLKAALPLRLWDWSHLD